MYCPKCGYNTHDLEYCVRCGNGLDPVRFIQHKNKWYRRPLTIVLSLVFFFPAGLFLMWIYAEWKFTVKVTVSVFFAIVCFGAVKQYGLYDGNVTPVIVMQSSSASVSELSFSVDSSFQLSEQGTASSASIETAPESSEEAVLSSLPSSRKTSSTTIQSKSASSAVQSIAAGSSVESSETLSITILSAPGTVVNGAKASITIVGKPNTLYEIAVYYTSKSEAAGLEPKMSDQDGMVTWTWKVGSRTKAGEHKIVISGGSEVLKTSFITVEQ